MTTQNPATPLKIERQLLDLVPNIPHVDRSKLILSFMSSLGDKTYGMVTDSNAEFFKLHYRTAKFSLAEHLYNMFNEAVFENELPNDLKIIWSKKLLASCGITTTEITTDARGRKERHAYITLSDKILTTAERLRDTLIHEMCHVAVWLINKSLESHGRIWNSWTMRARLLFPELPPIKRCHNYEVDFKYVYNCVDCGYSIGRSQPNDQIVTHGKCGYCGGLFRCLGQ